ncbi:MAG: hypothetical protein V1819_01175, partial [bacterium]
KEVQIKKCFPACGRFLAGALRLAITKTRQNQILIVGMESTDYAWVSFEEAKKYEFCPGLLGELEMVDKILKGENISNITYNPNL